MSNAIEFLAAAYSASEYCLAELLTLRAPNNPHTNMKKQRAELVAESLSTFLTDNGYQIVMYGPNTEDHTAEPLTYMEQPVFSRGLTYFDVSGKGGIFIAPKGPELLTNSIIEQHRDGVRLMAGRFENDIGFKSLVSDIKKAQRYFLDSQTDFQK